jgi:hypothetical protein
MYLVPEGFSLAGNLKVTNKGYKENALTANPDHVQATCALRAWSL